MHSLAPSESDEQNERRKLLLIYIHGFMGNETSFRSFPAHVHKLLAALLAQTHIVHTKIYPRYRSRRNIIFARDDFSRWLEPHEDAKTDVVLLGHSMGGLVCAEVALMPPPAPASRPLKHRILGTINFDVPFLGMHPGVVRSGLASIFKPAEETHKDMYTPEGGTDGRNDGPSSPLAREDTLWASNQEDPNYNPLFPNDVVLPVRKGWRNAWHFVNKHSGNLTQATRQLVSSHMEFGGAMANFGELKVRYTRIRALEEEDGNVRKSVVGDGGIPSRVRFINYYTASTGIPKKPKLPPRELSSSQHGTNGSLPTAPGCTQPGAQANPADGDLVKSEHPRIPTPRISVEEYGEDGSLAKQSENEHQSSEDEDWETAAESMTLHDPTPMEDDTCVSVRPRSPSEPLSPVTTYSPTPSPATALSPTPSSSSTLTLTASLPPIPDLPLAPPTLGVSYIEDLETRKLVEKEHARAVKSYDKAIKDRERMMKDRAKLEEKRERRAQKEAEKLDKDAEKAKQREEAEKAKQLEKRARSERKEAAKELTHHEKEMMRLKEERQRMDVEGRRMRGEAQSSHPKQTDNAVAEPPTVADDSAGGAEEPFEELERAASRSKTAEAIRTAESKAHRPPPKDRKFCVLPPKDSNGQRDPCWVRVFMQNVDEVGAHCGLFFVDERYERLVGDVSERIEGWGHEDGDRRVVGGLKM